MIYLICEFLLVCVAQETLAMESSAICCPHNLLWFKNVSSVYRFIMYKPPIIACAVLSQQALFFFFSIPPPFPTQIIIIIKKERDKHVHLSCLCVNFCLLNFSLSHFLFMKTLLLWFHSITRYTCSLWMLIRRCILLYSYSAHARLPLMVKVNKLKDLAFECFTGPNDCKNDIIFKPTWMFRGNHYHCCCSLHPGNALALNVPWLIA